MKTVTRPFAVLFILLISAAAGLAQGETVEASVFEAATGKAMAESNKKTNRQTAVTETFVDGNSGPSKTAKMIIEKIPPDRTRWIGESEKGRSEMILIGGQFYSRLNDGPWKVNDFSNFGIGMSCFENSETVEYKLQKNVPLGKETADLYTISKKNRKDACGDEFTIKTQRYWIAPDGRLLKDELTREDPINKKIVRTTTVYEYDVKITIEAPVIDFETLQRESLERLKNTAYRLKTTAENFDAGATKPSGRAVSVVEFMPPGRWRTRIDCGPDAPVPAVEAIYIDGKLFSRTDGGQWRVENLPEWPAADFITLSDGKFVEKTTLDGRPVVVYEEEAAVSLNNDDYRIKTRYWYDAQGFLLRRESDQLVTNTNERIRRIEIYEYDPNIKIEAPVK